MPPLPSYNSDREHYAFGLSVCMHVRAYVHVCVRAEAFLDRLANLCIAQKHRCGLFLDTTWHGLCARVLDTSIVRKRQNRLTCRLGWGGQTRVGQKSHHYVGVHAGTTWRIR